MPKKGSRRMQAYQDWGDSEEEQNYVNVSSSSPNNQTGSGRGRSGGGDSSQEKQTLSLRPWTQAVTGTVQNMRETQRALEGLQEMLKTHIDDLGVVDETRTELDELREEGKRKDEEILRQRHTIETLTAMDGKARTKVEHELAKILQDKQELELEKAKVEKRVAAAAAEERHKLREEFEGLTTQYEENYNRRKEEIEDEFARRKVENDRRVTSLEAKMEQLSKVVEEQTRTINAKADELEIAKEQCDILKRVKDSYKSDKEAREKELQILKEEFALSHQPIDYFTQRFADIYSSIEDMSRKYFHDIEEKDLEKVHLELAAADPCFEFVPIEDSEDSRDLRTAHAQRIISEAICEVIWKPLSSELTQLHPELDSLLSKVSTEIGKSSASGRAAYVWSALTMRALQSIEVNSANPHRTISARADRVIYKVFSVLSPLLRSSQSEALRTDLLALVNSAIDVWNNAQTGELQFTVSLSLERARHEEWRSQEFDPAPLTQDCAETNQDLISQTHTRVFTLFPRVVAQGGVGPVDQGVGPPGSWPREPDQICIHLGKGLPEWSVLVVRGKKEYEERVNYLNKVLEDAKKELHSTRRISGHSRRDSRASLTLGPLSPSEQWKTEGPMKFSED